VVNQRLRESSQELFLFPFVQNGRVRRH
jgi:hypothetical protein